MLDVDGLLGGRSVAGEPAIEPVERRCDRRILLAEPPGQLDRERT